MHCTSFAHSNYTQILVSACHFPNKEELVPFPVPFKKKLVLFPVILKKKISSYVAPFKRKSFQESVP